jgi:diguanylate cyclase (GGDEF)-like protein/PAS domain S-box-containing protein
MLYAGLPVSQTTMVVIAGLAAVALWSTASHVALATWLAAMVVVAGVRLFLYAGWRRFGERQRALLWFRFFLAGALLSGVVWGSAGIYVLRLDALESHLALILAIAGISAAAVPYLAPMMSVFYAFAIPALAPLTFSALAHGDVLATNLGVSTLLFLIGMIIIARRNNATIMEALKLRDENSGLVESLSAANHGLQSMLALLEGVINSTADGLLVLDTTGRMVTWNRRFLEMWGISEDIVRSRDDRALFNRITGQLADPDAFLKRVQALNAHSQEHSRDEIACADGRVFAGVSIPHRVGDRIVGRVWSFEDVTEQKRAENHLMQSAYVDALTGLPNRKHLTETLQEALSRSARHGRRVALLFIDLDGFKQVNDTAGHHTGDAVLAEAARRLRHGLRETDFVARMGGDEFVVLIEDVQSSAEAATAAEKAIALLAETFVVGNAVFMLSASVGISMSPADGERVEQLLKSADEAMYRAKRGRQRAYHFATGAADAPMS